MKLLRFLLCAFTTICFLEITYTQTNIDDIDYLLNLSFEELIEIANDSASKVEVSKCMMHKNSSADFYREKVRRGNSTTPEVFKGSPEAILKKLEEDSLNNSQAVKIIDVTL